MNMGVHDKIEYSEGSILSKQLITEGKMELTLMCMAADTSIGNHTSSK